MQIAFFRTPWKFEIETHANAPVHCIAKRFSNILQIHYIHYDIAKVERFVRCQINSVRYGLCLGSMGARRSETG